MSLLDGSKKEVVANFKGARPALDTASLEPDEAAIALNTTFEIDRKVLPREGFTGYLNYGGALGGRAFNSVKFWEQGQSGSQTAYLVYLRDATKVSLMNLGSLAEVDLITGLTDTSIAIFAPSGQRLAAAILSASGGGSHAGFIWDGNVAHTADQAFQRPMLTTEVSVALSQPGAGVCTTGTHSVGVLFQTRTGYLTRPGPANTSLVLQAATITATDSAHNIQVVVTPTTTWPTWIQAVQLIYTTAANTFQYYVVPGTLTTVTPGSATAATIIINVADQQIRSIGSQGAGTLADDYFNLLSMDSNNNPPFNVKFVVRWADRMVWFGNYGGIDSFFPSDPNNHQWISPDQHIKQLPGGLPISTAFVLRNILYVCSPNGGVWGFIDNGGRPVTFPKAVEIDSQIAVSAPQGVTTDSSGNAYALIGAVQGLYVFTGLGMPDMPVSWYAKPDWDQIDWTKFTTFQVKDHVGQHIFIVRATVKSGAVQLFTFNYRRGKTPDKVEYSTWTIGGNYPVGPIEIGLQVSTDVWEFWIFNATNPGGANVWTVRQKSLKAGDPLSNMYVDADITNTAIGINWQYNLGPMPRNNMAVLNHIALMLRALSVQAAGANLYVTVFSLDGGKSVTPVGSPFALAQVQDSKVLIPYDFQNEDALYRFSNNSIANNAPLISFLEHYYTLFSVHR